LVDTEIAKVDLTSTVVAAYTPTPIPATSTPETPPQPAVEVSLLPVNNTGLVYENETWLAKNANGAITATWTGSEWTYNTEVITVTRTIIGFEGQDVHLLDYLLDTPLDADTPEKHFTDPATGKPLPYGYVREEKIEATSTEGQPFEIPVSMFAVRMLGTNDVNDTNTAVVLEMPLTVDRSIIFTFNESIDQGFTLYGLTNEALSQQTSLLTLPAVLFQSTINSALYNVDLRGQQMLIAIYHDIPEILSGTYDQWNINDPCAALFQFIRDPAAPVPAISLFDGSTKIPPIWNAVLWVPASIVETLQAGQ
jgi:hypothetical protein